MASGSEEKNWWSNLDWKMGESVQETIELGQRALRNLPSTLAAHKLNQPSPVDHVEPDPVAKIKNTTEAQRRAQQKSKFLAPPPKPACLEKRSAEVKQAEIKPVEVKPAELKPAELMPIEKKNLEKSQQLRAADVPPRLPDKSDDVEETKRFTLEELLDPEYDGYKA